MSFKKNTPVNGFTLLLLDSSGLAVTTGTTSGFVTGDDGTQTALSNSVTHKANGEWSVDLTSSEMNFDNLGLTFTNTGAISVHFTISTSNDIAAIDVLNAGDIDGFTLEESQKLILASGVGTLSGAATTTITINAADGSKPRLTATVDGSGNRSVVVKDATG